MLNYTIVAKTAWHYDQETAVWRWWLWIVAPWSRVAWNDVAYHMHGFR